MSLEALRCVFEVHNGQLWDGSGEEEFNGLLGGFSAYNSWFCGWWLALNGRPEMTVGSQAASSPDHTGY